MAQAPSFGRRGATVGPVSAARPAAPAMARSEAGSPAAWPDLEGGARTPAEAPAPGLSLAGLLANYCNFTGRTRRMTFWLYTVASGSVMLLLAVWCALHSTLGPVEAYGLVMFLPDLSIKVRRLHDIEMSGFWVLLSVVPVAQLYLLYLWAQPGRPVAQAGFEA